MRVYAVTIIDGGMYRRDITEEFFDQREKAMSNVEHEIEQLEAEARDAGQEAARLQNKLRGIPKMMDDLQNQLNEATNRREAAITRLSMLRPIALPPVPSLDQMLEMARAQCPDRNPEDIKRLVGRMHASAVTGSNGGYSPIARGLDPGMITGPTVRAVEDTKYDIHGPEGSEPLGLLPDSQKPPVPDYRGTVKSYG
jgi:hypothetical protein